MAQLRLKRAGLTLPCTTRAQAINILRGVRPAIAKTTSLARVIAVKPEIHDACRKCGKPIPFGTPCKVCFSGELPEHIKCPPKKAHDAALSQLFQAACRQVIIINPHNRRQ